MAKESRNAQGEVVTGPSDNLGENIGAYLNDVFTGGHYWDDRRQDLVRENYDWAVKEKYTNWAGSQQGPSTTALDTTNKLPEAQVIRSGASADGSTAVDTNVIKQFADIIDGLDTHLLDVISRLRTVDVRAGKFADGMDITEKVGNSAKGLTSQYLEHFGNLRAALGTLAGRMRELGTRYERAEQLSEVAVDEIDALMEGVTNDFAAISSGQGAGGGPAMPGGSAMPPGLAMPGGPPVPAKSA